MAPGNHPPVDMFPFLQRLPEFLAPWKTEAREVRKLQRGLFMRLLEECEERLATGDDTPFYMADILRSQESLGLEREQLAYVAFLDTPLAWPLDTSIFNYAPHT